MDFYVYQLRLATSELPFYIGKGKGNRSSHHFYPSNLARNSLKSNTIKKATREGVEVLVETLHRTPDEAAAFKLEAELIAQYGRKDNSTGILANLTDGGEGASGKKVGDSTRRKLAAGRLGTTVTEIVRANMSKAQQAMTAATKQKMSVAATRPRSELWKQRNKEATAKRYAEQPSPLKGRRLSDEHKAKIKQAMRDRRANQGTK